MVSGLLFQPFICPQKQNGDFQPQFGVVDPIMYHLDPNALPGLLLQDPSGPCRPLGQILWRRVDVVLINLGAFAIGHLVDFLLRMQLRSDRLCDEDSTDLVGC